MEAQGESRGRGGTGEGRERRREGREGRRGRVWGGGKGRGHLRGGLRSKLGSFNPGYFFSKIVKNLGKKQKKSEKKQKKSKKKAKKMEKKSNLRRVTSQEVGPFLPD